MTFPSAGTARILMKKLHLVAEITTPVMQMRDLPAGNAQ
jgi:hypothetical protein